MRPKPIFNSHYDEHVWKDEEWAFDYAYTFLHKPSGMRVCFIWLDFDESGERGQYYKAELYWGCGGTPYCDQRDAVEISVSAAIDMIENWRLGTDGEYANPDSREARHIPMSATQ